jgi:hypothetical protein
MTTMAGNMPTPTTFWTEAAARLTPEAMIEAQGEWDAHKLGDSLRQGILVMTAKQVLEERGISMSTFGRVEAAEALLDAITMRAFREWQAALPVLKAAEDLAMSNLAYTERREDLIEKPQVGAATEAEVALNRALGGYLTWKQENLPELYAKERDLEPQPQGLAR